MTLIVIIIEGANQIHRVAKRDGQKADEAEKKASNGRQVINVVSEIGSSYKHNSKQPKQRVERIGLAHLLSSFLLVDERGGLGCERRNRAHKPRRITQP